MHFLVSEVTLHPCSAFGVVPPRSRELESFRGTATDTLQRTDSIISHGLLLERALFTPVGHAEKGHNDKVNDSGTRLSTFGIASIFSWTTFAKTALPSLTLHRRSYTRTSLLRPHPPPPIITGPTWVPHLQENAPPQDPTVSLCAWS